MSQTTILSLAYPVIVGGALSGLLVAPVGIGGAPMGARCLRPIRGILPEPC